MSNVTFGQFSMGNLKSEKKKKKARERNTNPRKSEERVSNTIDSVIYFILFYLFIMNVGKKQKKNFSCYQTIESNEKGKFFFLYLSMAVISVLRVKGILYNDLIILILSFLVI